MEGGYRGNVFITAAPSSAEAFRYFAFDADASLHGPLTRFGRFAAQQLAPTSVRCYLSALCPYFTWLRHKYARGRTWERRDKVVRADVAEYLVAIRRCQLREHRFGFLMVRLTDDRRSQIGMFLSALRLFYTAMRAEGSYRGVNPLARSMASQALPGAPPAGAPVFPPMPQISGVANEQGVTTRLTDSYFVIVDERWSPKPIDDPTFPARIFDAGQKVHWRLRETVVTRMLFETGARVSEVCGLTLGDWHARGLLQEATAFSKGSRQRRVKFVRFSANTAKLLRQYFDTERREVDPQGLSLSDYLRLARDRPKSLYKVPLFLTAQARALSPATFRDLYWRPACRASGVDADIHQTRHWYVTMAIRAIYQDKRGDLDVDRRVEELMRYMAWRAGKATLKAYEHYFDATRHAEIQRRLHARLDRELRKPRKMRTGLQDARTAITAPPQPDADWDLLSRLGGQ